MGDKWRKTSNDMDNSGILLHRETQPLNSTLEVQLFMSNVGTTNEEI